MKLVLALLPALSAALLAQTATKAPSRTTHPPAAHANTAHSACVAMPDLSPKVPALPPGLSCPRALYTLTTVPEVKLDYVSPMEGPELGKTLGLESTTITLAYVDTQVGSGPLAEPHKWYTINYTGYLTDGTKFDSSLDRKEPIVVHIGEHEVIPGWDTGFAGMHVGGKRRLFIPYQLAYGASGRMPTIPPKSELVFDVELLAQDDTKPEPKPAAQPATTPESQPAPEPESATPATPPSAGNPQR